MCASDLMGAPIIWDAPYQIGALVGFQTKRIDLKLGIMNGAPSAEPKEWNRIPWESYSPSYVVDILYTVSSPLKVGFSYSRGPYSTPAIESTLPYDATIDDYIQEIYGLNAAYAAGWTEVRAEIFWDRWEVPNVTTDPKDLSWMAEVKQKFMAGFFGAVRFGKIHFNDLKRSNGTPDPWDYDFERLQVGLGYNLTRTLLLKTEYMWNRTDGPYDPNDNLASVQLSWLF